MKVLVCGGREYSDKAALYATLDAIHEKTPITDIVHGAARGADMLAHQWAYERQVRMWPCPAHWKDHGRAAGPLRNKRMLTEHKIDLVVAFPGGQGTADMLRRAKAAGIAIQFPTHPCDTSGE